MNAVIFWASIYTLDVELTASGLMHMNSIWLESDKVSKCFAAIQGFASLRYDLFACLRSLLSVILMLNGVLPVMTWILLTFVAWCSLFLQNTMWCSAGLWSQFRSLNSLTFSTLSDKSWYMSCTSEWVWIAPICPCLSISKSCEIRQIVSVVFGVTSSVPDLTNSIS